MSYRIHIDIPIEGDLETATKTAKQLVDAAVGGLNATGAVLTVQFRLGHDDDRQRSNYLDLNANGHASNRKCRVSTPLTNP